ncbi:MAG: hypothetical protein ACI9LO_001481 [Planctomycetota bacterium]|jgi:hypothetical protein
MEMNIDTVANVIDIAVAPVFLLAGISGLLMVLTNRLGRAIDRSRSLQATQAVATSNPHKIMIQNEIRVLLYRVRAINLSISMATLSALLVCILIIALFGGSLLELNVSVLVASLFILTMLILSLAFCSFLVEIFISTRNTQSTLVSADTYKSYKQEGND